MRTEAATALPDTCSVSRLTRTPDGRGGYTDAWNAIATGVACRISPNTRLAALPEQQGRPGQLGAYAPWRVKLPANQDVTVRDRIVSASFLHPLEVTAVSGPRSWEITRDVFAVEAS